MKKKGFSCLLIYLSVIFLLFATHNVAWSSTINSPYESEKDSIKTAKKKGKKEKDNIRRGWTFGALPSVAYDADLGFQYGALANVYFFGDGSIYPEYYHSFYVEAAYTTKNYGIFRFFYDSKYLIPNHRLSIDLTYLPDAMCDFYGYNGYSSVYNDSWVNSKKYTTETGYKSRAFYKFQRDILRFSADIQGKLGWKFYWNAGVGVLGYSVNHVNIDFLNKGKKTDKKLPNIDGLYDKYVLWGIIPENESRGGWHPYIHGGITFDSRDKQQNPRKGIFTDFFLTYNAAFGKQKEFNNLKLNFTFRHYVPIYQDYIIFAYRAGVQLTTSGKSPFYLNSYMNNLFMQRVLYEGLGGGNSLRGILRNRILSNGFGFANAEFRFKICKFKIKKENFYIGLNPFVDMGIVLQPYKLNESDIRNNIAITDPTFDINTLNEYFNFDKKLIYQPHLSGGIGLKIAMNENFILSIDWAMPFNKQDGAKMSNFYIKIGYMF